MGTFGYCVSVGMSSDTDRINMALAPKTFLTVQQIHHQSSTNRRELTGTESERVGKRHDLFVG